MRGGYTNINPASNNGEVVNLRDKSNLTATFAYLVTDNVGVEVLAGLPFEHEIFDKALDTGAKIGSGKHLPPTVTLQYYFNNNSANNLKLRRKMSKIISIVAILGIMFFSVPTFAKPVELHYWHGHTGKLENIINNIAERWNSKQNGSRLIPTSKGSYEDILAAFIAAYRAGEHPHMAVSYTHLRAHET